MDALVKRVLVAAGPAEVWPCWTTTEGLKGFLCERSRVDLRLGGDFEILFDPAQPKGMQGSEGCVVVAFREPESLSFTWNFPPSLPTIRAQHTVVTVRFAAVPEGCEVTLTQDGFRDEGEWPAGRAYFDRAWGMVLEQLRAYLDKRSA